MLTELFLRCHMSYGSLFITSEFLQEGAICPSIFRIVHPCIYRYTINNRDESGDKDMLGSVQYISVLMQQLRSEPEYIALAIAAIANA